MYTIDKVIQTEHEQKKSRFLSFLCPYSQFESLLEKLKKEHPKAVHFVWAYRFLNQHKQIEENQTDDGEPHRTSGFPTLNVLRGNDMVDVAIITIRYWGGTMLGMGGLVKAYGESAKKVVAQAQLLPHLIKTQYNMHIRFSDIGKFEHKCKTSGIDIIHKDFDDTGAVFTLEAEEEKLMNFLAQ